MKALYRLPGSHRQRGVTLMDFLMWSIVATIMLAVVLSVAGRVREQSRAERLIQDVEMIRAVARRQYPDRYINAAGGTGVDREMADGGQLPAHMINPNAAALSPLINPYGGAYQALGAAGFIMNALNPAGGAAFRDGDYLIINALGLSVEGCVSLAQHMLRGDWIMVSVNNILKRRYDGTDGAPGTSVVDACNNGAGAKRVSGVTD